MLDVCALTVTSLPLLVFFPFFLKLGRGRTVAKNRETLQGGNMKVQNNKHLIIFLFAAKQIIVRHENIITMVTMMMMMQKKMLKMESFHLLCFTTHGRTHQDHQGSDRSVDVHQPHLRDCKQRPQQTTTHRRVAHSRPASNLRTTL